MRPCCLAAPLLAVLLAGCEPGPDPLSPPPAKARSEAPSEPSSEPAPSPLPPSPAPGSEPPVVWKEYPPSAPGLRFVGRLDDTPAQGPVYAFPGGTVRLRCECQGVDVLFEDEGEGGEQHTNFIDLRVDGVSAARVALAPGVRVYPGVRGLTPGPHLIELVNSRKTVHLFARSSIHHDDLRPRSIRSQINNCRVLNLQCLDLCSV